MIEDNANQYITNQSVSVICSQWDCYNVQFDFSNIARTDIDCGFVGYVICCYIAIGVQG